MGLPGYAAEAGLYRSRTPYRGSSRSSGTLVGVTVIPQQTCQTLCSLQFQNCLSNCLPPEPPPPCPAGRRCCEPGDDGTCFLCWPKGLPCP
jgi:hypothetical protein